MATDTPVLDFWWHLLWVSKPEWAALFTFGIGIRSLRFTSGVTAANLLRPAWQPIAFPHACFSRGRMLDLIYRLDMLTTRPLRLAEFLSYKHLCTVNFRICTSDPTKITFLCERSQNTVLLASTQAVYKAPHSTVRHTFRDTFTDTFKGDS